MTNNTNVKKETSTSNTTSSPVFTNDIDPVEFLDSLEGYLQSFESCETAEDIQVLTARIQEDLEGLVIIGCKHIEQPSQWIMSAISICETSTPRTIPERISHLISSGGVWLNKTSDTKQMRINRSYELPFNFKITNQAKNDMLNDKLNTLYVSIVGLQSTIKEFMKGDNKNCQTIGLFKKADGIINANRLKNWLVQNGFEVIGDQIYTSNVYKELSSARYSI